MKFDSLLALNAHLLWGVFGICNYSSLFSFGTVNICGNKICVEFNDFQGNPFPDSMFGL